VPVDCPYRRLWSQPQLNFETWWFMQQMILSVSRSLRLHYAQVACIKIWDMPATSAVRNYEWSLHSVRHYLRDTAGVISLTLSWFKFLCRVFAWGHVIFQYRENENSWAGVKMSIVNVPDVAQRLEPAHINHQVQLISTPHADFVNSGTPSIGKFTAYHNDSNSACIYIFLHV